MDKDTFLLRIARHLIINASFLPDLGLYHGKMGIVLFFSHYARYSRDELYDDFASKLLDEIYEEISPDMPINFESGLCGIGWGIEYLLENGFMGGDSDEILLAIDQKIMERDLRRITDKSRKTGLEGIGLYIEKRLHSQSRNSKNSKPFDERYLCDWESVCETISLPEVKWPFPFVAKADFLHDPATEWELGLSGCAGVGLSMILL